jgi:hypothetical protein
MATQLILNPENQPVFFEALEKLGTPGALALAQMAKEFTEETDVTRIYRKAAQLDAYAVSAAEEGAWVSCWIWVECEALESSKREAGRGG